MNIVLLGSQGVGKGTYAQELKNIYDLPHISTGDLFRAEMKSDSELGKKLASYVNAGQFVPDELVLEILKKRLEQDDAKAGFLLDGFPRTLEQAKALDGITKLDKVLHFFASEDVIVNRLGGRRICRKCGHIYHVVNVPPKEEGKCDVCGGELYQREDDQPEAIKKRLADYKEKTMPLINYYKEKGLLAEIDANLDISHPDFHVIDDVKEVLDPLK